MCKIKCLFFCLIMLFFSVSAASAEETVKIGAIFALTGEAAANNASSLAGVRSGVHEINKQGGILGKKIQLLVFDNFSTPIRSSIAAEKAADAGVSAIVGPAWSSHAIAIAKVAQGRKIPMISNVATNPKVTKIGNYIFRACFIDDFQGEVMAQFAHKDLQAATAIVFIDLTSDFSMGLAEIFKKRFEQLGGKILLELKYKYKQKSFKNLIEKAKQADADVLFMSGHDESGQLVNEAQDAGIASIPIGSDGWDSHSFFEKGGVDLKRGYHCAHWSEASESEISRKFVNKYKNAYNLNSGAVLGYDAVLLLADAIRRAGSADRAKIRDAIADTSSFKGVTGDITFDENGDPVKSAVIMTIENGKPRYLKTMEP